ncbi:hypothetical protein VITFI_CDS0549 [Vitreoscilla filiformis]|uniref:AlpA family phage regulatory protein n=1 Tax=Vitreoscilla filiformis TaxID=63 RepID=A0A221KBC4_VITFI|nr:AlpA family phage regulatory protein [Vitreoscilla filiformis]ASM76328.1 hypothetical protein VITFI_CDS0549 [Vitreoscilla filiformis]
MRHQKAVSHLTQNNGAHAANIAALTAQARKPSQDSRQTAATAHDPDALLRTAVFAELAGTSVSWVYRQAREGMPGFPKPVKMGARCTRWRSGDVRAFLQAQSANV